MKTCKECAIELNSGNVGPDNELCADCYLTDEEHDELDHDDPTNDWMYK